MKKPKLLLILFAFLAFGQMAWAQGYDYIAADGTLHNTYTDGIENVSVLDGIINAAPDTDKIIGYENMDNWFIVQGNNVVLNGQLKYQGNLNLILCDGAKLTVTKSGANAIENIDSNATLTIYVQTNGTGQLVATASGNKAFQTKNLTIHGGVINATGGTHGIYASSNIVINGGTVTAVADGKAIEGRNITINGGIVSATGDGGIQNGTAGKTILGYTNSGDRITATNYLLGQTGGIKVKDGQYMITDNNVIIYGGLNENKRNAIAGHTLMPYTPTEWSGSGTAQSPYIISSIDDLNLLSIRTNGGTHPYSDTCFKLGANINFNATTDWDDDNSSENNFTAIAGFDGHFDGDGYTISGLRIYANDNFHDQNGLFANLGPNAYIEDVTLSNARITGQAQVGGIAGNVQNGATITNCHVSNTVAVHAWGNTLQKHGGIAGVNSGTITNCVSEATVSRGNYAYGSENVGGIAGYNKGSLSNNKVFNANLTAADHYGAIAGLNDGGTLSNNYYHACTVNGTANTVNIGVNGADITTGDGALSLHTIISKPDDVTIVTSETVEYNSTKYWAQGKTVTLSGGLTGEPTEGWQNAYKINGVVISENSTTIKDNFDMPAEDVTITIGEIHADWAISNAGTEADPYKIYFTDQLDLLATRVNNDNTNTGYAGKYFKLMKNLEYDTTVQNNYIAIGNWNHQFKGCFDGNNDTISGIRINKSGSNTSTDGYQGIFGYIQKSSNQTPSCEVKNLTIDDADITAYDYAGGIVGYLYDGTVTNCHATSTVFVRSTSTSVSRHGGIVGSATAYSYTSEISHCTSSATLTSTNANGSGYGAIAGTVAKYNNISLTVSDNLAIGATVPSAYDNKHGAIVGENYQNNSTLAHNYYHNCTVAGEVNTVTKGCQNANVTQSDGAIPVFTVSIPEGVTASATPTVTHNSVNYYKESVPITLTGGLTGETTPGCQKAYVVYGDTLIGSNLAPGHVFDMQNANAVVTVVEVPADWAAEEGAGDTEENPYKIYYTEQLDLLATRVNAGESYSGKYFKLMDNLTYDNTKQNNYTAIGNYNHQFKGCFDGNYKTISGIRINKSGSNTSTDDYQGIFGHIGNGDSQVPPCKVKNLTIDDADITSNAYAGGIVGFFYGGTVTNCHATSTVFIRAVAAGANSHGGIVGEASAYNTAAEISHCTSSATLTNTSVGVTEYGAIVGAIRSGVTMSDNFAIEATVPSCANNDHGAIVGYNNGSTLARNYYHNCTVDGIANATNKGCDNANVVENDGAMPVFTLSLASGISADVDTTLIQDEVNYYKLGTTVTLSCATPAPAGYCYVFSVNDNSIAGNTFNMESNSNVSVATEIIDWANAYSGTACDPYLIGNSTQWDALAASVNNGTPYGDAFFKLTADISINTIVGDFTSNEIDGVHYHPFSGTFDGNGHTLNISLSHLSSHSSEYVAPFACISGATIKNLHITGYVTTNGQRPASITSFVVENSTITNCWSEVDISSSYDKDIDAGGLVARVNENKTITITDCLFSGRITYYEPNNKGYQGGGMVGWTQDGATATLKNCLFAPTTITVKYDADSNVFVSGKRSHVSVSNCFYNYEASESNLRNEGTDASHVNNPTLRNNLGDGWEIKNNEVVPIITPYTFSGEGTEESPYIIASEADWNGLANNVYLGEIHSCDHFKMSDDISVTTMVGANTDTKYFAGTFDGNGYKLTVSYDNTTDQHTAAFRDVKGATIKNLHVDGTITTNRYAPGGIVANNFGVTLINCRSSVSIISSHSGDAGVGGLIAYTKGSVHTTIEGCLFDGSLTATNNTAKNYGGFMGWVNCNDGATVSITNSFYKPDSTNVTSGCKTFVRSSDDNLNDPDKISITNSYYTETLGTAQGKQAHTITGGEGVSVALAGEAVVYDVSGITTCGTGMMYSYDLNDVHYDVLYAGYGDAVNLNLGAAEGYIITGHFTVSAGNISGMQNPYIVTMPNENVTINANHIPGVSREITGYGNSTESDRWAFIASPIQGSIAPSTVGELMASTETEYDLYRLNPSTVVWENYKEHVGNAASGFNLVNGRGYLYATKEDKTLSFSGSFNTGAEPMTITDLPAGFNLVGNPFIVDAYVNKPYYTLNGDGSAILTTTSEAAIPPCYGVIVQVNGNETVTFSKTAPNQQNANNNSSLNIALTQANTRNNAVMDNAIVSFNEGSELSKFYFGTQDANIYIPQDGEEYAIVSAEAQGEIPVCFKARENGEYTLTISSPLHSQLSTLNFTYLHLIDNLTGSDVDLLVNPSYTFTARNDDYESRFRLVFVANNANLGGENNNDFAFFSNGQLIVTGEGTLQIIDMVGRVISTEIVNGTTSKAINAKAGIYVLRLITGENVKTQKIVVR